MDGMEELYDDSEYGPVAGPADEWIAEEKKECLICEKVMAVIGMAIAGFLFAIAMDLISGGKFSQMIDGMFARGGDNE